MEKLSSENFAEELIKILKSKRKTFIFVNDN